MPLRHATTIITRSVPRLINHLNNIKREVIASHLENPGFLVYALSANTPDLETTVSHLREVCKESIGCLSAPLTHIAHDENLDINSVEADSTFSCSLAVFDRRKCVPFRSTVPGEEPISVGRTRLKRSRDVSSDSYTLDGRTLDTFSSGNWENLWVKKHADELAIPELHGVDSSNVRSVLYFSDGAPEGLSKGLHTRYPHAHQLGLVGSSTPFINGLPFNLMKNGTTYGYGAVGIALVDEQPFPEIRFPGLRGLEHRFRIGRIQGNLIQEFVEGSPSQLLLDCLRAERLSDSEMKEGKFFLRIQRADTTIAVYRIISGDPKKGTMALEKDAKLQEGDYVQFMYRQPTLQHNELYGRRTTHQPQSDDPSASISSERLLGFMTVNENETLNFGHGTQQRSTFVGYTILDDLAQDLVLKDTFIASSENGFVWGAHKTPGLGTAAQDPWRCMVPDGYGTWRWDLKVPAS